MAAPALLSKTITTDWFGQPIAGAPTIALALEGGALVLRAGRQAAAECHAKDAPNAFIEGLWEWDCAEAFLCNPVTGYYLEINLGPHGAWWACAFSAKRQRATPHGLRLAGATGAGTVGANQWQTELRIPLASLPAELAFSPAVTCANLTFCLGTNPQRYLTCRDLGGGDPDFHLPEKWGKMTTLRP